MLRAVGLRGDGGTGDLRGATGAMSESVGLAAWAVEMLKDNLGFADREASMLMGCYLIEVMDVMLYAVGWID